MIDLEEVAVALDAFPHWDENMRAEVFHAIDVAPSNNYEIPADYFKGEGWSAWNRVREYELQEEWRPWPKTLDEASGYESTPTKEEILKALYRGAGMIR